MNFRKVAIVTGLLLSILGTVILFQNFTLFGRTYHLSAFPNVCNTGNKIQCSVEVSWSVSNRSNVCLYRKSTKSKIACGRSRRIFYTVDLKGESLELREGASYSSPLIDKISVLGIQTSEKVLQSELYSEHRTTEPLVMGGYSFSGGIWDGKIFFERASLKTQSGKTKVYIQARALLPQKFAFKLPEQVNFIDAYSKPYLLVVDPLTKSEQEFFKSTLSNQVLGLSEKTLSSGNFYEKDNLNLSSDPSYRDNPYVSDISGKRDSRGQYLTYRFQLFISPTRVYVGENIVKPDLYDEFLAGAKGYLVIENPDSANARIVAGELEPVEPLRDIKGQLMNGHEPALTLDGRLMIWDGLPKITRNRATYQIKDFNQFMMYSYRVDAGNLSGWTEPKSLSDMYYLDGPGKGEQETRIDGIKFSAHFPIAKYPIRDDLGRVFKADQPIFGSYPWITPDGTDLVYSSMLSFSGNQRRGTVVVGERTKGKIRYIEGGINPFRGVTPSGEIIPSMGPESNALAEAYSALKLPLYNNRSLGPLGYWNIALSHLVVTPGAWNGLEGIENTSFPYSFSDEVYGFLISKNMHYAEVPLPVVGEDLLLWLPMNESISFSRAAVDNYIMNPSRETRSAVAKFRTNVTPDMSIYHQSGKLNAKAQFPYEHYEVAKNWKEKQILLDRNEGANGNSVFLSSGGQIDVTLKRKALGVLNRAKRFHVSFWIRPNPLQQTPIFFWNKVLKVEFNQNKQLELTHYLKTSGEVQKKQICNLGSSARSWTHILISRDLDRVRIYIDGQYHSAVNLLQDSFPSWSDYSHNNITLGPSAISRLDIDEVIIGTGFLTDKDIFQQAKMKVKYQEWPNASKGLPKGSFFSAKKLLARIPRNNLYSREAALVGKLLFNEKILSSNKAISCASCHIESISFADSARLSKGVSGLTHRNSPSLINLAFRDSFFWDGSASNLESQVLHPFIHSGEMGLTINQLVSRVENNQNIKSKLVSLYGAVNPTSIAKAMASFIRSLTTPTFNFEPARLSALEHRGWKLFGGRANCISCHSGPLFSDDKIHDTGLSPIRFSNGVLDLGAFFNRGDKKYEFAMKTPSLINVRDTAPYFHDGRFSTLEEVVDFYNKGGDEDTLSRSGRSPLINTLSLNRNDREALVAFLKSLYAPVNKL